MAKASNKSDLALQREEYPEPNSKKGVVSLVDEILKIQGGVERIILERGQPVRVWRWTEKNDLFEESPTLEGALAHAEIIEYVNPDESKTAPEELFHVMSVLKNEAHKPVCWATGRNQTGLLRKWLRVDEQGVPFDQSELLGIPIEHLKSLPEDTLLLCGARHYNADTHEVTIAIKTAIEIKGSKHDEEEIDRYALGVRDTAEERGGSAREESSSSARDNGKSWYPPSFIRTRLGSGN